MTKKWGAISRSEFQSHYTIELMEILSFQAYHNSDVYSLNQHHVRCTNTVIEVCIFTQIFLRLSRHASVISKRRSICCLSLSFIQILVWKSIKWMNHILTFSVSHFSHRLRYIELDGHTRQWRWYNFLWRRSRYYLRSHFHFRLPEQLDGPGSNQSGWTIGHMWRHRSLGSWKSALRW